MFNKLKEFNAKVKALNDMVFNNPVQDQLIKRFEILNKAMQANTRQESEHYLNLLK